MGFKAISIRQAYHIFYCSEIALIFNYIKPENILIIIIIVISAI